LGVAQRLLVVVLTMQPIDPESLSSVFGGSGALLGSLAQSAGPILNGIAGIIGAAKGGGASAPAPAAAPEPAPPPTALPVSGGRDPLISVSVSINGQQVR
jgi:hypothetical protein